MKYRWYVYMLECSDKTIYTGVTKDVRLRVQTHNKGHGAKYTKGRCPVKLLGFMGPMNKGYVLRLEWSLKKLTHRQKLQFILSDNSKKNLFIYPHGVNLIF